VVLGWAAALQAAQQSNPQPDSPALHAELPSAGTIPFKNLLDIIREGGILMIPILACSFLLAVFLFERVVSLRKGRVIPEPFVRRILHQIQEGILDRNAALALCDENRSPVAAVFSAGLRKWGKPSVEVEQAILDAGERAVNGLRKYLRVFNGVATVGPLLGLLGTVFGMIECFNNIAAAQAMGRPQLLAGGISQALLTTAAGLSVAIPALILYMYFVSRVDRLTMDLDARGQELVELISAEALETAARVKTVRKARTESQAA
jgi:biopolymer transport protein ExbB